MTAFQRGDVVEHHITVGFSRCIARVSKCSLEMPPAVCLLPFFSTSQVKSCCLPRSFLLMCFIRSPLNKCSHLSFRMKPENSTQTPGELISMMLSNHSTWLHPNTKLFKRATLIHTCRSFGEKHDSTAQGGSRFFSLFWWFYLIFHLGLYLILRYVSSS